MYSKPFWICKICHEQTPGFKQSYDWGVNSGQYTFLNKQIKKYANSLAARQKETKQKHWQSLTHEKHMEQVQTVWFCGVPHESHEEL